MLTMNDLRVGVTITEAGDPWVVLETDFMKKAQRRPVMRTKIRNLRTGAVKEHTFKQGDSIPEAEVTKAKAQFLYRSGGPSTLRGAQGHPESDRGATSSGSSHGDDQYTFMDTGTYEQYTVANSVVGGAAAFLREGLTVDLLIFEGSPVAVQLPIKLTMKVVSAPPGVRGDSASNISKEVVVEGDMKIKAPLFVKEGDSIVVDTRTGEYVGKAGVEAA